MQGEFNLAHARLALASDDSISVKRNKAVPAQTGQAALASQARQQVDANSQVLEACLANRVATSEPLLPPATLAVRAHLDGTAMDLTRNLIVIHASR
jgi:hypothetical protein